MTQRHSDDKEAINLPAIEIINNTGTLNPSLGPDPMFSINKGAKRNQSQQSRLYIIALGLGKKSGVNLTTVLLARL
jgi:hypothetical protein